MILTRASAASNLTNVPPASGPSTPTTQRRIKPGPSYRMAAGSIFAYPAPRKVMGVTVSRPGGTPTTVPIRSVGSRTHKGTIAPGVPVYPQHPRTPVVYNNARQLGTLKNVVIVPTPQPFIGTIMNRLRG